jgi:alpha-galactosidase
MTYTDLPRAPAEFLTLHGRSTSLVIEQHADEGPLWRYWGPRLADGTRAPHALREQRMLPAFMLDHDQPLTVMPGLGVGWFGQSALLAHRAGRDFSLAFARSEVRWIEPGRALELVLHDTTARIRATLHVAIDAHTDVLRASTTLENLGDAALDVQWLAAMTLPLPADAAWVRSYAGQHNHEFLLQVDALTRSTWQRESRRGRTSHDCHPSAVVTTPGATQQQGLVYGAHLAWSGNHRQCIEWLHDGSYQWQLGEWLAPGEASIEPGTSWRTPEVVASLSTDGLDGLAANFHAELRRRLPWHGGTMSPRPVHLNTWEAIYFDHRESDLFELANAAADVGIERFVLDDGWFQGRHNDRAALGDWWADRSKYPQGLQPLAQHVVARGMQFGLWFEPEMVNPDSELHRAHPDWALQLDGRPMLTARNQLVLDIARPEVSQDLYEKMHALLSTLPIAYIKWDHNRDLAAAGDAQGRAAWHRQVGAAYALIDRIRRAFPALEIESCSGGGGRIDFGVLSRTHRVWTSDCIDAQSRVDIQRGFLQFFPPEVMGAHIGTAPSHSTGRSQSMAFRGAVALSGHLGVELDVRKLDAPTRQQLMGWIALYKQWRDRLHHGRVWLGDVGDHVLWQMHGDVGGRDWLFMALRRAPSTLRYPPVVKLAMLDTTRRYRLRSITPDGLPTDHVYDGKAGFFEALASNRAAGTDGGVDVDGDWLVHAGLPMPRAKAETAFIVHLQAL